MKSFTGKKIASKNRKNSSLKYSKISLLSAEAGYIPNYQIQAIKLSLRRIVKKRAQIFVRLVPNRPITKKPNELRLGRGKGNLKY